MTIATTISVNNSLNTCGTCIIDGDDEFYDYLDDKIYELAGDLGDTTTNYKSEKLGNISIRLYIDKSINTTNLLYEIYLRITCDTPDIEEDSFIDAVVTDNKLINKIKELISNFIEFVNKSVISLVLPKNEYIIYKDGRMYIETIIGGNYAHQVEWVPFELYDEYDDDDLIYYYALNR